MKNKNRFITLVLMFTCILLFGCSEEIKNKEAEHPAEVEEIEGTEFSTITLTDKAIERIGLQTAVVSEMLQSPLRLVVPYSAIIYDPKGQPWVYTNPQPRTFVRYKVNVDYINGEKAYLLEGPPAGTVVAKIGVAELYGTEFKVGH